MWACSHGVKYICVLVNDDTLTIWFHSFICRSSGGKIFPYVSIHTALYSSNSVDRDNNVKACDV